MAIGQSLAVFLAIESVSLAFLFFISLIFLYCLLHKETRKRAFVLVFLSFAVFFVYTAIFDKFNVTKWHGNETKLTGTVVSVPIIDGDKLSFQFSAEKEKVEVRYYLQSEEEKEELKNLLVGMTCQMEGKLSPPSPATNFYAFDYDKYLYYQRIHWLFTPAKLRIENCIPPKTTPVQWIRLYRQKGIQFIDETFPEELKGIASALIFGHRHMMDEATLASYEIFGIVHLLAVSGLHVGLIVSALFYLLLRIGVTKERVYEILITILPIYVIFAGAAPSAIRAALMTMVVLFCLRLKVRLSSLDIISLVYVFYLTWNPYIFFHIGFQLSFLLTYSLILSAKTIFSRFMSYWKSLLAVTLQAQFISLPLIFYHFYEISWLSIPLNLLYIPFISIVILPGVFIAFFLSFLFLPMGKILLLSLEKAVGFAHELLAVLQQVSFAVITVGKISPFCALLMFASVVFGLYLLEKQNQWRLLFLPAGLFLLILIGVKLAPYVNPYGEVTFIDVGQGDSILIELPFRKAVYLIDAGGQLSFYEDEWRKRKKSFDVGRDIVAPYLKAKGITTIDKLILTHGDFDHIGGAEEIRKAFRIKEVNYPAGLVKGEYEKQLLTNFQKKGVPIHFVKEGDYWQKGGQSFYVLSPTGEEQSENNRSIVIYAIIGGIRWLFTGDLEVDGEQRIINKYEQLRTDIVKAGHHGSKTSSSSAFISHIEPKAAVISVGRNNRYNHPHKEVLDRFAERNIRIFRTDEDGAIRFVISRHKLIRIEKAKKD